MILKSSACYKNWIEIFYQGCTREVVDVKWVHLKLQINAVCMLSTRQKKISLFKMLKEGQ